MSRGNSGRIVLEIDPSTKDQLYIALAKSKLTLKDWFLDQTAKFIQDMNQPTLFVSDVAEASPKYQSSRKI